MSVEVSHIKYTETQVACNYVPIEIIQSDQLSLASDDATVCLSGAFPSPTHFILHKFASDQPLSYLECHQVASLEIKDFLDELLLNDMYSHLVKSCIEHKATRLIIDATAISFGYAKKRLGTNFEWVIKSFLKNMCIGLKAIISHALTQRSLQVTIICPSINKLNQVSTNVPQIKDYVEGFPTLELSMYAHQFFIMHNEGFNAEEMEGLFKKKYPTALFNSLAFWPNELWKFKI